MVDLLLSSREVLDAKIVVEVSDVKMYVFKSRPNSIDRVKHGMGADRPSVLALSA
jgi:hypothetical protein